VTELLLAGLETDEPVEVRSERGEIHAHTRRAPDKDAPNEDACAVFSPWPGALVLAVADGLGGAPSGAAASAVALERLGDHLERCADESALRAAIMDGFEDANAGILDLGVGAGTTLVVTQIVDDVLRVYHVGDSVALVVGQRGKCKLETMAHSPVGYGVAAGLIDPDAALHHDDRHYLSNHLGASDMHIEVGSPLRLAPRDTLLLATDGLVDNLLMGEIVDLIRMGPLGPAARVLAERCAARMHATESDEPTKPDDATFLLYRPARSSTSNAGGPAAGSDPS